MVFTTNFKVGGRVDTDGTFLIYYSLMILRSFVMLMLLAATFEGYYALFSGCLSYRSLWGRLSLSFFDK